MKTFLRTKGAEGGITGKYVEEAAAVVFDEAKAGADEGSASCSGCDCGCWELLSGFIPEEVKD